MADLAFISKALLTKIGDAIRKMRGTSDLIPTTSMADEILAIETGSDVSGVTATASDVRNNVQFVDSNGQLQPGSMQDIENPKPSISFVAPKFTVSVQSNKSGYLSSSSAEKTASYTLNFQGPQTYTPTTNDLTIGPDIYLKGEQRIKGDSNLVPSNIVSGASIFDVKGTAESIRFDNLNGEDTDNCTLKFTVPYKIKKIPAIWFQAGNTHYHSIISMDERPISAVFFFGEEGVECGLDTFNLSYEDLDDGTTIVTIHSEYSRFVYSEYPATIIGVPGN